MEVHATTCKYMEAHATTCKYMQVAHMDNIQN